MNSVSIHDPLADVIPALFRGLFEQPASGAPAPAPVASAGFRVDVREQQDAYLVHAICPAPPRSRSRSTSTARR
jgi:hypothetical protein